MTADNVTERAAAELYRAAQRNWKRDPGDWNRVRGDVRDWHMGLARALDAAGLLVTPKHDAAVAAKALREAAEALDDMQTPDNDEHRRILLDPAVWLHDRADRIEREAGES